MRVQWSGSFSDLITIGGDMGVLLYLRIYSLILLVAFESRDHTLISCIPKRKRDESDLTSQKGITCSHVTV